MIDFFRLISFDFAVVRLVLEEACDGHHRSSAKCPVRDLRPVRSALTAGVLCVITWRVSKRSKGILRIQSDSEKYRRSFEVRQSDTCRPSTCEPVQRDRILMRFFPPPLLGWQSQEKGRGEGPSWTGGRLEKEEGFHDPGQKEEVESKLPFLGEI